MHESLFTFAIEKPGRIGLPGPVLSPATMLLCGQNQQLPLPWTVQSKTYSLPPGEISATRHTAGLLTTQDRVREEDQKILYKDNLAIRNHTSEARSTGRKDPLTLFCCGGHRTGSKGEIHLLDSTEDPCLYPQRGLASSKLGSACVHAPRLVS